MMRFGAWFWGKEADEIGPACALLAAADALLLDADTAKLSRRARIHRRAL